MDRQDRDVLSGHLRDKGAYARGRSRHPGKRFFGNFLVATRKFLALGCENPIQNKAARGGSIQEARLLINGSNFCCNAAGVFDRV